MGERTEVSERGLEAYQPFLNLFMARKPASGLFAYISGTSANISSGRGAVKQRGVFVIGWIKERR